MNEQHFKPLAALLLLPNLTPATAQESVAPTAPTTAVKTNDAVKLPEMVVQGQAEPTFKVDQVSSPKFTQPILDTPQTIVAIPKEVYLQQGAQTLSDVLRNTPGISFAAGEGGNVASGDSFFMRGFDTSGSIFRDGVRDTGAYSRDVFDIEQVEIAKGPAGADNGRGGSSGYINLATKTPMLGRAYAGTMSYGSSDSVRGSVDLNQPLNLGRKGDWINSSSLRLNGMAQDGGVPGRAYVDNQRWGISPSLALGLGTPTRVYLAASWMDQDNLPDSGLPVAALPGGVLGEVNQEKFYGLADRDFERVTVRRVLASVEHDVTDTFTLRNQLVFARADRDALTTYIQNGSNVNTNTGVITPRRIHVQTQNEIISEQVNGTFKLHTGSVEHDLSAGIEFAREKQFSPTWVAVNGPATSAYQPDPFRAATAAQTPYFTNNAFAESSIDTAAAYLFDTTKINDHLQLNASVRGEHYQTEYRSRSTAGVPGPYIESDDVLLSWKAGIVFKPRDNGSLYFSYANSFTPPGTTFTLSTNANNANNPVFDPQENINYELGTKWEFFNQRLFTSLALYRSENLNNIVTDSLTGDFVQDAKNVVQGIELGVAGKITERWMINGGMGYMHSEYQAPSSSTVSTNSGAALRFTPEWTASLWTAYNFKSGLTIGGGARYSSSVVRSTGTSLQSTDLLGIEAPDSLIFDAMLAYAVTKNFTLRLNVDNLADDSSSYRLNNNGGRYYPTAPRTFRLAAELSF